MQLEKIRNKFQERNRSRKVHHHRDILFTKNNTFYLFIYHSRKLTSLKTKIDEENLLSL